MNTYIYADMVNGNRIINASEIDGIEIDKCQTMDDVRAHLKDMGAVEGEAFERVLEVPNALAEVINEEYGISNYGDMKTGFKILCTGIADNCQPDNKGSYQPSEVSVVVKLTDKKQQYYLDYQTTTTSDYGAYSSTLRAYDGAVSYAELEEIVGDEDALQTLIVQIAEAADVQGKWDRYMDSTYQRDTNHFGMDANSEINSASKIDA